MKKSINIAFVFLMYLVPFIATSQQSAVPNSENWWYAPKPYSNGLYTPFTDERFKYQAAVTVCDVYTNGLLDTSMGTYTLYGKYWSTRNLSGLPRVTFVGKDSTTIDTWYRYIGYTSDLQCFGKGPWINYGNQVTIATHLTGTDTLVRPLGSPKYEAGAATDTTGLLHKETGYIQFKYVCIPTKAVNAGTTFKARGTTTAGKQVGWKGEAQLTFRRKEG